MNSTIYRKRSIVLKISMVYPSMNRLLRMHYREREKCRHEFQNAVKLAFPGDLPRWCLKPPVRILIDLCFQSKRKVRRDKDNFAPKFLLDALVKLGIISDDNSNIVQEIDVQFYDGEPKNETVVKLEEI